MKKNRTLIRTLILLILISAIGYTFYINFFKEEEVISKGNNAPNFAMTELNTGEKFTLSGEKGKGVIINFWGTWCEPCKREMPFMNELYLKYKDKGIELLALNADESKFSVERFVSDYKLKFPIAIDKDQQVLNTYGVNPLPTTFFVSPDGKIKRIVTGQMTPSSFESYIKEILPK
ncbi:thiol-disulfide oxidoreductase ResA [Bacillus sp. EAC]|uniref:thiol-disulfide oxidoreductase ResA n=1 Tax=Bacillus sp. EAC TaxID=1978338 RepID=UPI000B44BF71|nr:thiol-disulfide oxidoreductase ResA [Bacillus sp. EAC]